MNWKPISEAPKDGTKLLVWDGYDIRVAWWGATSIWSEAPDAWIFGDWSGDYCVYEDCRPTH